MLAAETLRQMQPPVAAAPGIDFRFHRRRGGSEHDRNLRQAAAHHRHVAGMIMRAVLLLIGGVVLLIDDDQAKIGIRQKQRRARADHNLHLARRNRRPGARALARRELRMPFRRRHAEARGETVERLRGERDFRHQDQRLLSAPEIFRHRLVIDFGLARSGDAVDQGGGESAAAHALAQRRRGLFLRGGEIRLREIRIGLLRHRLRRQHDGFQRLLVDQAVDHAGADAGFLRRFPLAAHNAVLHQPEHAGARRRHARRRRAGKPHANAFALRRKMLAHAQRHAQHHAARGERVVGNPVDEAAQFGLQRRDVELFLDVLQPVVEAGPRRALAPDHAGIVGRAKRHRDKVARGKLHAFRHPIGISLIKRHRHQNIDNSRWPWPMGGRFRAVKEE